MNEVICFDSIVSNEINEEILDDLKTAEGWRIAFDFCDSINHTNIIRDYTQEQKYSSDAGFILSTLNNSHCPISEKLNFYAELITNICLSRTRKIGYHFKNPKFIRVFWNYYNSSSYGSMHTDDGDWIDHTSGFDNPESKKFYSLIYYLNTCDGCGTKVTDFQDPKKVTLYPSVTGNAILFPSNTLHGGTGAPHMKQRYCLNVMFESEMNQNDS